MYTRVASQLVQTRQKPRTLSCAGLCVSVHHRTDTSLLRSAPGLGVSWDVFDPTLRQCVQLRVLLHAVEVVWQWRVVRTVQIAHIADPAAAHRIVELVSTALQCDTTQLVCLLTHHSPLWVGSCSVA